MMPVLALALISHGASVNTISLLLGVYSLTALLTEFPSGVFADIRGRKTSALFAYSFAAASFFILLFSNTLWLLFLSMFFAGLGRAFASGSIDALAIDDAVSNGIALVKVTSRLSIFESAGLAAGALAGGCLSGVIQRYMGNLITCLLLNLVLLFLLSFFVKEKSKDNRKATDFRSHVRSSIGFLKQKGLVRILVIFAILTGFALFSIETYWQPAFGNISSSSRLLGVISFAGFVCVISGSKLMEFLFTKKPESGITWLIVSKLLLGVLLPLFLLQRQIPLFIGVYMSIYFFVGSGSVAESTLLNSIVSPDQRAGILSLFSFILQAGGILTALIGYIVSMMIDYRMIWLIAGVLLFLGAGVCTILYHVCLPCDSGDELRGKCKVFEGNSVKSLHLNNLKSRVNKSRSEERRDESVFKLFSRRYKKELPQTGNATNTGSKKTKMS